MLIGKQYATDDIISLRLTSGDEVIGKYISEDMSSYTLSKPMMLSATPKGVGLVPVMMTVNPDRNMNVNKATVICTGETVKEIADQYTFQTTGIQPVSAVSIVTG